ncbi:AlpA family phage regulatory protein [Pseudorhizobium endolithicum]|uniref:AlpA family phage regulatory protein n=1 Tax=Pseudorhizobium endolithicum TaxID=1191678 RepID=A0ABM8PRQ2_9HYPH|nr:AlpA family phage regulatory protein [Pseudorhizobium endolithicum]CAD7044759.1 AlpA family phage regulatory protein [Pseudorhizobium endolithicum]
MVREIIRKPEVKRLTGYADSTLYKHIAAGRFPKPIKLSPGGRASGWFADEIASWQESRVKERDGGAHDAS